MGIVGEALRQGALPVLTHWCGIRCGRGAVGSSAVIRGSLHRRETALRRQVGVNRGGGRGNIRGVAGGGRTGMDTHGRTAVVTRLHLKRNESVDGINDERPAVTGNPAQRLVQRHRANAQFVFGQRLVVEAVDAVIGGMAVGEAPAGTVQQLRQRLPDCPRRELAVHGCLQIIVAVLLADDGVTTTVILALRRGCGRGSQQHQCGGEQPVASSGTLHIRESFLSGGCCNVKTPCVIIRRDTGAFARAFVPYSAGAREKKR